jgi:diadenosine tetraphosphate (Ap4A) HIT family hydrolase
MKIHETKHFMVESCKTPLLTREDGGHILIISKNNIPDRTYLQEEEAIEFVKLSILVGKAMEIGLKKRGIKIVKINYQENGNWAFKRSKKPRMHLHFFGRVENAKYQKFPDAVYLPDYSSGFYEKFKPLDKDDIKEIQSTMKELSKKCAPPLN